MNIKRTLIRSIFFPIIFLCIFCFAKKATYTKITNNSSYTLNITSFPIKNKKLKSITINLASTQTIKLSTPERIESIIIKPE